MSDSAVNTIAIGIPTINRYDLLKEYLSGYLLTYFRGVEIFVMDNGDQDIGYQYTQSSVHVIKNPFPKSVAASWNSLCQLIYINHSYALILNDDIYLERHIDKINTFLTLHQNADIYLSQQGFCSFILPKRTFLTIGGFDENFKGAYFEDRDYERRLKMAKANILKTVVLNPTVFNESSSIKKDKSLNKNFESNAAYYQAKWGGAQGGETFITPFNK